MRSSQGKGGYWDMRTWTPLKMIVVANIVVFVLQHFFHAGFMIRPSGASYSPAGALSLDALKEGRIWTLITYMFVHSGFERGGLGLFHIGANLLVIILFGRKVQEAVGAQHFSGLYFAAGLAGAMLQLLVKSDTSMVGASACGYGVLLAYTCIAPENRLVMFFPLPIELRARTLGRAVLIMFGIFALLGELPTFEENGLIGRTAHFAHLGGALMGMFYMRWLGYHDGKTTGAGLGRQRVRQEKRKLAVRSGWSEKLAKKGVIRVVPDGGEPSYDAVLDKMKAHGIKSLTSAERQILEEASVELRERDDKG